MRNSLKKAFAATIFAMFVALPFAAQATEQPGTAPAHMPISVQESLSNIVSTPLTMDGGLIVDKLNKTPFTTHETTNAACLWICMLGSCHLYCW